MDGIDAVLTAFDSDSDSDHPRVVATHSEPLPDELHRKLYLLSQNNGTPDQVGQCDTELGLLFGKAALQLLKQAGIAPGQVSAIGSHGQTIRHQPEGPHPFTLQIADPNRIAELTGITTIADFRRRDMAVGGQGAPLAPAFHQAVFSSGTENRCLLNLGGIANITWLPAGSTHPMQGFDTGPANGLMDAWCEKHRGCPFDEDGNWARTGRVDQTLLSALLSEPYFCLPAPKSTGKELFNLRWLENHLKRYPDIRPKDVQRTLLELTLQTVCQQLPQIRPLTVYACGGGARNTFFMEQLAAALPDVSVSSTDTLGLPADWVEGAAFAWLARRTLAGLTGNSTLATGAREERILGGIYPGNPADQS